MRYIKLYLHFLRFSFSKAMEFRIDFFFRVLMDIIFYIVQYFFFKIIYLHTPILGGWNLDQMTIFVASFIFVDALYMSVFANNAWWFPISINRGDLDYYLTRPASAFFFLTFKEFAANSLLNFLLAVMFLFYCLVTYTGATSFFSILIYIILLINGAFLYYMVFLIFLMTVFWTQSPRGFADVFYSAEKILHRPDGIFTGIVRSVFLFILPFSMMASYPAKFLIENSYSYAFQVAGTSALIYLIVYIIWKKGLRDYSSASS